MMKDVDTVMMEFINQVVKQNTNFDFTQLPTLSCSIHFPSCVEREKQVRVKDAAAPTHKRCSGCTTCATRLKCFEGQSRRGPCGPKPAMGWHHGWGAAGETNMFITPLRNMNFI